MDQNNSVEELQLIARDPAVLRARMATVQVLVWLFIYIDIFMLFTFLSKQVFRSDTRYVLFAHTLLVDSAFLLLTDLVVLFSYFYVLLPVSKCILLCLLMEIVTKNTAFTITAMCLERYVAICMPLRHATISTTSRTMAALVIIWIFSSLKASVDLFILIAIAPQGYFAKPTLCHYEIMILTRWHCLMRAAFYQVDFVVIMIIILFCYAKIMLAAQVASGENQRSASKGRRTLLLHSLQLFLCMVDMWCPYIEAVVMERSLHAYLTIRFVNFTAFTIVSRALSPLIYGLRDKKFCLALTYYMSCRMNNHISAEA
ncbi:hypothetical protein AAFF_G00079220 [Aldrovandia affinis]|uniref:G-protein coupled receptors family 1 profile domain-containing protein n=1 Tax=Aldrovandia affinis TaxID=143900 RepID=A0AAD7RXA7_9TELE|nr:hypothetical protein AAFF_G00079220 [Aldrovandia affinis]